MEVAQEINQLREQLKEEQKRRILAEQLLQKKVEMQQSGMQMNLGVLSSALLKNLHYAFLITDASQKVVYLNQHFCELFQLPGSYHDYLGKEISFLKQHIYVAFLPTVEELDKQCVANQHIHVFNLLNGTPIACEVTSFEYDSGQKGTAWLYRELTSGKEKQKEQSDILDVYPYAYLRVSYKGEILLSNRAAKQLLNKLAPKNIATLQRLIRRNAARSSEIVSFGNNDIYLQGICYHPIISPVKDKGYINIYLPNVTEARKRDLALKESQDLIANIVNTVPNIIYINDYEADRNIYLNNQVVQLLGYDQNDVAAMNGHFFISIISKDEYSKLQFHTAQMCKAKDGEVLEVEYKVIDKAGNYKWINCRESVYKRTANGEVSQIIGSARDITHRILHQKQLSSQKEYYETILNLIPSDVVVFDKHLRFQYVNPNAIKNDNVREWVIGKTEKEYSEQRNLPVEVTERRARNLCQALETKRLVEFEETLISREGETLHFLRRMLPHVNEAGEVEFIISNGYEITALKLAQQDITIAEAKMRAIISAVPDLMLTVDENGVFLNVTNHGKMTTVVPQEELLGKSIKEVLPGSIADEIMSRIKMVLESGILSSMEYSLYTLDGYKYREARIVKYDASAKALIFVRDITDKIENEFLLKEQNELISQVMNTSSNLIFAKDKKGRYTFANTTFAEHFGYSSEYILGKTDAEVHGLYSDEVTYFSKTDQIVYDTMELLSFEEKFTKPDGEVIWLKTVKKPLLRKNGEINVLGISADVTAERKAIEKLEKREQLYRLLSENSKDLICLHDIDGTYTYISQAVNELFGYTPEELLGTSPYDITHPDDAVIMNTDRLEKALGTQETFIVQNRKRRKDGTYIWVETNIRPILNEAGETVQLQSSTRDITERRRANEALHINQKKYKDLVSYSRAYILSHDLSGNILNINPYSIKELDYTLEEMVGSSILNFLSPDQNAESQYYLKHIDQYVSFDGVFKLIRRNNEVRYIHFHCYKVEEQDTEPYVISIGYDLTERLLIEEELKKAKEAAESSARVKENFLANMSHEIRTPLNGILGMANLLNKTTLSDQQQNYLNVIKSSSDNLLVVINDILDIAKIEAGKVDIEQIPFNLSETITAAFNSLKYKAEEKDIQYVLEPLTLSDCVLDGDPYRLQQILLNLLNNAIKFTDEGGVRLRAQVLEETDEFKTIEFSVKDTGIGIAEEKKQSIFESFTQAYSSITRQYGGTGLGLNICKNLVELQGGRIWVDSIENLGSIFRFVLTYPKSKQQNLDKFKYAIDYSKLSFIKVLLAEDNEVNIYLAESLIRGWGASVDTARNGKEAVDLISKGYYDVVLMDIQMPIMNGLDATRIIRKMADPLKSAVPIIALTANAIKGDAEKYMSVGMDDYISKPFEEEKLFMTIAGHIKRRQGELLITNTEVKEAPSVTKHIKTDNLFSLQAIYDMSRGDMEFLKKTKQVFIDTIPTTVTELQHKCESGDWIGVSAAAHNLKSMIDLMQIQSLQKVIRSIESDAKEQQNLEEIQAQIAQVSDVIGLVVESLESEK